MKLPPRLQLSAVLRHLPALPLASAQAREPARLTLNLRRYMAPARLCEAFMPLAGYPFPGRTQRPALPDMKDGLEGGTAMEAINPHRAATVTANDSDYDNLRRTPIILNGNGVEP